MADTSENGGTSVATGVKFPFGLPGKTSPLTSPTAPKTGINFHHGFPGKSLTDQTPVTGTTKHNVSTNTNHGRGGFRGSRGGGNYSARGIQSGRGRGNNRGRGGYRGNFHNNNNNNNNYVQLGKEKTEENIPSCEVCDRPKTHVQCFTCGWTGKNLRVKTACTKHPKVNFLGDLSICPICQLKDIQEMDDQEMA